MYAWGETINYACGDRTNIKITTAEDIGLFEGYVLIQQRRKQRKQSLLDSLFLFELPLVIF